MAGADNGSGQEAGLEGRPLAHPLAIAALPPLVS